VAVEVLPVLVLPVLVVVLLLLELPQATRLNAIATPTAAAMSFLSFISFPPKIDNVRFGSVSLTF
jgi:hypothetical protein